MNYVSTNILYLRKQRGIIQSELASYVNKSGSLVGGWENGVSEPSISDLITLSNLFGISLDDLVLRDLSKGDPIGKKKAIIERAKNTQKGDLKGDVTGDANGDKSDISNTNNDSEIAGSVTQTELFKQMLDELRSIKETLGQERVSQKFRHKKSP